MDAVKGVHHPFDVDVDRLAYIAQRDVGMPYPLLPNVQINLVPQQHWLRRDVLMSNKEGREYVEDGRPVVEVAVKPRLVEAIVPESLDLTSSRNEGSEEDLPIDPRVQEAIDLMTGGMSEDVLMAKMSEFILRVAEEEAARPDFVELETRRTKEVDYTETAKRLAVGMARTAKRAQLATSHRVRNGAATFLGVAGTTYALFKGVNLDAVSPHTSVILGGTASVGVALEGRQFERHTDSAGSKVESRFIRDRAMRSEWTNLFTAGYIPQSPART